MRTRDLRSVIYLAGGLGLIVSIYAYLETVQASLQKYCTVNAYVSCGAVASSGRTTTFGIPDALIGVGGFIVILIVVTLAERQRTEFRWPYLLLFFTTVGVGFSLYFVFLELAVIHALCPVCAAAWTLGWVAWGATIALVRKVRAKARARARETVSESAAPEAAPQVTAKS